MPELFQTFANNLLPILIIGSTVVLLGKLLNVDPRPLGRVIFYIFSPVLVFSLIIKSQLSLDKIASMLGIAAAVILISGGVAWVTGRLMRFEQQTLIAVLLTSMFINAGNYGLPLVSFAFGEEALAYASIFFVASAIMLNTVGVLIASLGHLDLKKSLLGLLKVPHVYAIILGLMVLNAGWILPAPLARAVSLLANGAIPAMLVLLGIELQRVEWSRHVRAISVSATIRLVIGPLIGLGLASLFGLSGAARQAAVTQSAMPAAVMITILASEYKLEPSLVTASIFVSTVLSPLTLTPLLVFLGK